MSAIIYVEGGGDDAGLDSACREGFSKLFEKCGLEGRMPRVRPYGSRKDAYDAFKTAHEQNKRDYIGLLVDSEDPIDDLNKPWEHLANRKDDQMFRPKGVKDDQALVMATCMETWIIADRKSLKEHYKGGCLQENALPPLNDLENRERERVFEALKHATRRCSNAYDKGRPSFEVLGKIEPDPIRDVLPSFARMERILREKLG